MIHLRIAIEDIGVLLLVATIVVTAGCWLIVGIENFDEWRDRRRRP